MHDDLDDREHAGSRLEAERSAWQAAADLVRVDLVATTDLDWPLTVEAVRWDFDDDDLDSSGLSFPFGSGDQLLAGYPLDEGAEAAALQGAPAGFTVIGWAATHLAGMVQEDVIEHYERPWPECPVHRRPLDPQPTGPTGQWVCGQDPAEAAPIGGLEPWLAARRREC